MELYYKLLDLIEGKYTTHETVEEVRHYITHRVSDMQHDYKVTDKLIRTPFPNYDFHYVIVEDDNEFREFVYFFDTIEEELDSRDDDRDEIKEQRDRAIKLLNEKTTALFNANRTIEFLRKCKYDLEIECLKWRDYVHKLKTSDSELKTSDSELKTSDSKRSEFKSDREHIEYLKEAIKSKESRIDILEAGIKESERNEEFWKSQYNKYKEFVESMHKQSVDFMYGGDDDDD